jgi:uncharacterized membrane protein
MYSKVTIAGHPVHPMLVAYPVAGYTGTLVGYAVFAANGQQFWLQLAIALNIAAVGMALVAAVPGLIDWAFGIPRGSGAKRTGLAHASLNVAALALFAVSLGIHASDWSNASADVTPGLALSCAGLLCTLGAGFLGWMLVQTYHVGVTLTPHQQRDELAVQQERPHLRLHRGAA